MTIDGGLGTKTHCDGVVSSGIGILTNGKRVAARSGGVLAERYGGSTVRYGQVTSSETVWRILGGGGSLAESDRVRSVRVGALSDGGGERGSLGGVAIAHNERKITLSEGHVTDGNGIGARSNRSASDGK